MHPTTHATRSLTYLFIFIFYFLSANSAAQSIIFDDSSTDSIIINNGTSYELAFSKNNGSFLYIKSLPGEDILTHEQLLWEVSNRDSERRGSHYYHASWTNRFEYSWNDNSHMLSMHFIPDPMDVNQVQVTVTVAVNTGSWFDMQISVINQMNTNLTMVFFPCELPVRLGEEDKVILPGHYPGVMVDEPFFTNSENYFYLYPDVFHADYISVYTSGYYLSLYTLRDSLKILNTEIGLKYVEGNPAFNYSLPHTYRPYIENDSSWTSPVTRCWINESPVSTLNAYRTDNGIDNFPSLKSKLGSKFEHATQSVYYTYPFTQNPPFCTFSNFASFMERYPAPGVVMLSMYYTGGFHGHHPDYLPPDPQSGTTEEFTSMVAELRELNMLSMPFTLPVWWHEESPTLLAYGIENIEEIARLKSPGVPAYEGYYSSWLEDPWDYGYYMSPASPFVQEKYKQIHTDIFETYGCDFIYEDVLGCPGGRFDFNANASSPADFLDNWNELAKQESRYHILAENAYDRMAEYLVGGMASRADGFHVFPTAPILYNDKMLTLNYWNPTNQKSEFSYHLIYSHPMNMIVSEYYGANEPFWIPIIHDFQVHVMSRILGKQMTSYTDTSFYFREAYYDDMRIRWNRDNQQSLSLDQHMVAPDGVLVSSENGDLTAGVFTSYNDVLLLDGEHFLIEKRGSDTIMVKHPGGNDTPVSIQKLDTWTDKNYVHVRAEIEDGLVTIPSSIAEKLVQFELNRSLDGDSVLAYYIIYDTITPIPGVPEPEKDIQAFLKVYPSPFTLQTNIGYRLPAAMHVHLGIYSASGQTVRILKNEEHPAGVFQLSWDGTDETSCPVPAGLYFIRLASPQGMLTKAMIKTE